MVSHVPRMKTRALVFICFAVLLAGKGAGEISDSRPEVSLIARTANIGGEGWRPLFNGEDLSGWESFLGKPHHSWDVYGVRRDADGRYLEAVGVNKDPMGVFTVAMVDGRPALRVSGQGFGTVTTKESFGNFHLRLQVKWGDRRWLLRGTMVRDSGLLYFGHGPLDSDHGRWPRSIEFQIQERNFGDVFAISAQTTVPASTLPGEKERAIYTYDPAGERTVFVQEGAAGSRCARSVDAERPHGEWNTLDLICIGGDSIHIVNGQVVMRLYNAQRIDGAEPAPLTSGRISLRVEGAEVYYRGIEIRPITEVPAEWR